MGIRANTGLKTIEVNDNGDTISLSIADNNFLAAFSDFTKWLFDSDEKIKKMAGEYNEAAEEDKNNLKAFDKLLAEQKDLSEQALSKLESLFGEGACKKIFGEISPNLECVIDIVVQIMKEIKRFSSERNQYIAGRYSRSRKGADSK